MAGFRVYHIRVIATFTSIQSWGLHRFWQISITVSPFVSPVKRGYRPLLRSSDIMLMNVTAPTQCKQHNVNFNFETHFAK